MTESTEFVDEFFAESSELPSGLQQTHRVDVVLVTHDGGRWLPRTLAAIRGSRVQPDAVHVVDTESIDNTREILDSAGPTITAILTGPRQQAYGASIAQAVETLPAADTDNAWIWLLHDDSAPAADGLEILLKAAEVHPDAAVLGMKSVGWNDSSRLQDVGLTMTAAGHRDPRIERGERDQGQYTESEEVLAVGSAGMLIRRDVWNTLNGMREIFPVYRDDIDFCWRAWEHGYRVRVIPQAEIAHREAATHAVRAQDIRRGTAHKLGRLHALGMTYIHTKPWLRPLVLVRLVIASLARAFAYFIGKDPRDAGDELSALYQFLRHPNLMMREITERGVIPIRPPRQLRPTAWVQLWHGVDLLTTLVVEKVDDLLELWAGPDAFDVVEVIDDGSDAIEAESEETFVVRSRRQDFFAQVWKRPGTILFTSLLVIGLIGTRTIWGSGSLQGGALLPVTMNLTELIQYYLRDWHTVDLGTNAAAGPWMVMLALWSIPFGGNVSLAVAVMLALAIPAAGLSAHLAARSFLEQAPLRAFFAATYALSPALLVAIGSGRLGTIVLAIALPMLVRLAWRCDETWRRAGAMAILIACTAAWVPAAWMFTVLWGIAAAVLWRRDRVRRLRLAFIALTSFFLLFPASLEWILQPTLLLREAGVTLEPADGFELFHILLLQPGGPTSPWLYSTVGVVAAAVAALIQQRRRRRVAVAWIIGVVMFGSHVAVWLTAQWFGAVDPATGLALVNWSGPFTLVLGIVWLIVIAAVSDGLSEALSRRAFGWRHIISLVLIAGVAVTPVVTATSWLLQQDENLVQRGSTTRIPAFVLARKAEQSQSRILLTRRDAEGSVRYSIYDGRDARLGDADVQRNIANDELTKIIGSMLSGRDRTDAQRLAEFGIMYVVSADGDQLVSEALDGAVGLRRISGGTIGATSTWEVQALNQRAALVWLENGKVVVEPLDYTVDPELRLSMPLFPAEEQRIIAIAEAPGAWRATLNGEPLEVATNYQREWRQAWRIPSGIEGQLVVEHRSGQRVGGLLFAIIVFIGTVIVALPTYRPYDDVDPEAVTSDDTVVA